MTATMTVRSTITANTVRLQDRNIMGFSSIYMVDMRERSASLDASATAGNEQPEEERSRQPAAQGPHGLSGHVPS